MLLNFSSHLNIHCIARRLSRSIKYGINFLNCSKAFDGLIFGTICIPVMLIFLDVLFHTLNVPSKVRFCPTVTSSARPSTGVMTRSASSSFICASDFPLRILILPKVSLSKDTSVILK
uniref:Wsv422 n=1 Tax=White spot syndrome virus TaxID=92652 RepID=A0A2U9GCV2_WSSV|nr:wsv422 [Shrimp white spot syndrome virus]